MKILVTGAEGQLGSEVMKLLNRQTTYGFGKDSLDITNVESIREAFSRTRPDVVINCAAYTNVDGCEANQDKAFDINAKGVGFLASECLKNNSTLVHISTDYVFDGKKNQQYFEFDKPNPLNAYGRSKFAGEEIVRNTLKKFIIVRTSWLYGANGKNFVKTMLELAKTREHLEVVNDQIGSPTYAADLAEGIIYLINNQDYGTYHITNSGYCSWYDFAFKIFEIKNVPIKVTPIDSGKLIRPAVRPTFSVLANSKSGFEMRNWEEALEEYLNT